MKLFKKSFTLYVERGMREVMEIDIDILRNEQSDFMVMEDFKERFHKLIVGHYLCMFHCFYLHSTSNHFLI